MKKRTRKDYFKKDFKNPFFHHKKSKKSFFILILILLILGGTLYFLNKSSYFQIKDIQIEGNETIPSPDLENIIFQQLTKKRFFIFSQSNIFFFSKSQAKKNILKKYLLEELKIKKKLPKTLIINLKERKPAIIWVTGEKNYFIDFQGYIVREISLAQLKTQPQEEIQIFRSEINLGDSPIIYDLSSSSVQIGQQIISQKLINFVNQLTDLIKENITLGISHYQISSQTAKEINLITIQGPKVYFSQELSLENQINNLKVLLDQKIPDPSKLEYIDLRFGERIFWK